MTGGGGQYLPNSGTTRRCTMNFCMGEFPSKPGVQDTLTARCDAASSLTALTFVGAKGSSMTDNTACRV